MRLPRTFTGAVFLVFAVVVLAPLLQILLGFAGPVGAPVAGEGASLFDERHLGLAANSLQLAFGATVLSLLIGVPLAFLLSRVKFAGNKVFSVLCLVPALIPPYMHAIVWTHLHRLVKPFAPFNIYSLWGAVWVLALAYYPFVLLTTLSGLNGVDKDLEEAALLGCSMRKTLRKITLPLVAPQIFAGATFVFIFSLVDFSVPDILRFRVYPVEIFIQYSAFHDELAALKLSLPLVGMAFALIALQMWFMKDRSYFQLSLGFSGRSVARSSPIARIAFLWCFGVCFVSVFLPAAVLISVSGSAATYWEALIGSGREILYSLLLASSSALVALLLGFSLAYIKGRSRRMLPAVSYYLAFMPLAIPSITMGIALIDAWNRPLIDVVYGSPLVPVLGHVARFIPFAVMIMHSSLKHLSPRIEEAAFLTTARFWTVLVEIVLPVLRHGLFAAFAVVFILSLGELGTTLLIIPPGYETIPIKIYNLMHYGAEARVGALCILLIGITLALFGGFLMAGKRLLQVPLSQ